MGSTSKNAIGGGKFQCEFLAKKQEQLAVCIFTSVLHILDMLILKYFSIFFMDKD